MKFRSGFEKRIYENAKKSKKKLEYEPNHPRIGYVIPYRYIPDFVLPNGIFVEAKGYLRPRDRTKMRKVREQNPNLDIRFLFQTANQRLTKSKNSEMYWQWAERLGFKWSEGEHIPDEWWSE
jgi:hypothetical protein